MARKERRAGDNEESEGSHLRCFAVGEQGLVRAVGGLDCWLQVTAHTKLCTQEELVAPSGNSCVCPRWTMVAQMEV